MQMNFQDNIQAFQNEIRAHGWDPGPIRVDGRWHAFDTAKRKDKAGRYRAFSSGDFVAGCIWDWKSGLIATWNSGKVTQKTQIARWRKTRMAAAKQRKIDIDLLGLIADSMHCLADDMMAHAESGRDVDERNLEFW